MVSENIRYGSPEFASKLLHILWTYDYGATVWGFNVLEDIHMLLTHVFQMEYCAVIIAFLSICRKFLM